MTFNAWQFPGVIDMTETSEIYEEYLGKLKKGIFEVTFTKVNGEQRIMNFTLHDKVIPQATKKDPLTQTKVREINENVVSVWDVKAEGWRSFRTANVTEFKRLGPACTCGKTQDALKKCDGSHRNA